MWPMGSTQAVETGGSQFWRYPGLCNKILSKKKTKQSYVYSSGMGTSILSVVTEAIMGTSSQHYSPPQQGKPRHQDDGSGGAGGDLWQEGLEALCDRQTLCFERRHPLLLR